MSWFYHAPGEGRIGPLSADELRRRYRERRIQRDTLVWREGLREWQPLERVADEVDLFSVTPDASLPPPLPAAPAIAMAPAAAGYADAAAYGLGRAAPQRRRMSGCLVALIVVGVLAVPMTAILAAIALPAYRDYTVRAKVAGYLAPREAALRMGTERARDALGRCPEEPLEAGLEGDAAEGVRVGQLEDGRCAFEIAIQGVDPKVDGSTIVHVAPPAAGGAWDCTGGDLPRNYRSAACRGTPPDTATP
ncbi:MAG: GYF domain-containing protein [Pseudomonadota bacterium]